MREKRTDRGQRSGLCCSTPDQRPRGLSQNRLVPIHEVFKAGFGDFFAGVGVRFDGDNEIAANTRFKPARRAKQGSKTLGNLRFVSALSQNVAGSCGLRRVRGIRQEGNRSAAWAKDTLPLPKQQREGLNP